MDMLLRSNSNPSRYVLVAGQTTLESILDFLAWSTFGCMQGSTTTIFLGEIEYFKDSRDPNSPLTTTSLSTLLRLSCSNSSTTVACFEPRSRHPDSTTSSAQIP